MKKFLTVRNIVIVIFFMCICFMSYGFAKYNKSIGFSGNLSIPSFFEVYISDIKKIDEEFVNASGTVQSYSDNNAVLPVTATDKLFTATYLITITNTYLYDMVFSGISIVPHVVSGSGTVDHYIEMTNYETGESFYPGSSLTAESDTVLKMKVYYTADSVVSISTDIGVVVIPEKQVTGGSLSKGNINKNTGSFNDDRIPDCFTANFINSYSYANVVGIVSSNANYKVVKSNGRDFGNIQIPANSETTVEYCLVPLNEITTRHDDVNVNYLSYSSGETFNDALGIDLVTLVRTLKLTTNMNDGLILCNNVTTGIYNILDTASGSARKTGTAKVKIGDTIECSIGDGDSEYEIKNEYVSGNTLVNYWYERWTIVDDDASLNKSVPLVCRSCISGNCVPCNLGNYTYNQSLNSGDVHTVATTGTYTVPKNGYYLIELWGGQGGNGHSNIAGKGGSYGYTYGLTYLNQNQVLYYTLGGDGFNGNNDKKGVGAGGANGGGTASCSDCNFNAGGGGGWSAIFNDSTTGNLLMLSAGGGAGSGPGGLAGAQDGGDGGAGGTVMNAISSPGSWTTAIAQGTIIYGSDAEPMGPNIEKKPTSQGIAGKNAIGYCSFNADRTTEKGSAFVIGNANHAGVGGSSEYHGAPGGGGYFGGGGAVQIDASSTIAKNGRYPGGGGGGASFISSSITFQNLSNAVQYNLLKTRPGSNGGAFRISFLFDTLDGV